MGFFDRLKGRQIRDQLKNEAYFKKYIQQQEKRISNFENTLELGELPKERLDLIEERVAGLKSSILTAKYSMGVRGG